MVELVYIPYAQMSSAIGECPMVKTNIEPRVGLTLLFPLPLYLF